MAGMFRFSDPYILVLLVFIPVLAVYRMRGRRCPALRVSSTAAAAYVPTGAMVRLAGALPHLKYAALALMILALARPQWGTHQVNVKTEGINIILAVDISGSMAALDFQKGARIIDRLQAVKGVIDQFVAKRFGDRIGLVVFGTHAYTQLPLTRDYNTIVSILNRVQIGAAGKSTAIGDAIGISLKRLSDIPSKSNIIILLTDGSSNSGELSPESAAEIAAVKKVRIYTIGVGREGEAPFRVNIPGYGERYVYQRADLDEKTLRMIADKTHGMYFRAQDTDTLEKIYNTIDKLEKTEVKVKAFDSYRELYRYPLIPALCLLALWMVLSYTRFLRIP
jgi:Ca-activated chloride channel homolog